MNLIAIGGCSGSGKTVLARALEARLGDCAVITLDAYYNPQVASLEERARRNYDHPDSLDWPLLETHLKGLLRGVATETPRYLFDQHTRAQDTQWVAPARVILVEGILALYRAEVRALAGLRVFVETNDEECLRRRLNRDIAERGRTAASVLQQYEGSVRPMAREYVLPSKQHAHLVVSGERPVEEAVETIVGRWLLR